MTPGELEMTALRYSLNMVFLVLIRLMMDLGSWLLRFLLCFTFNPKLFIADWFIVSEICGSIKSEGREEKFSSLMSDER